MDTPDVPQALTAAERMGLRIPAFETTYFLSRETVVPAPGGGMLHWRERLFAAMSRNAGGIPEFFRLPDNAVVELDTRHAVYAEREVVVDGQALQSLAAQCLGGRVDRGRHADETGAVGQQVVERDAAAHRHQHMAVKRVGLRHRHLRVGELGQEPGDRVAEQDAALFHSSSSISTATTVMG